jgi:hypothetical protein
MKIPPMPFTVANWSGVTPTVHPGVTERAIWRTFTIGELRVRWGEDTAGYRADRWCDLGHVLYVLEAELDTELRDERKFKLLPGMSYQVCDDGGAHIARRRKPAQSSLSLIVRQIVKRRITNVEGGWYEGLLYRSFRQR